MDYGSLKSIVSVQSFNIIWELINRPTIKLYTENISETSASFDPYDDTPDEIEDLTTNGLTYIDTLDAIYTYDKNLITDDKNTLGSVYSLSVYLRFDDVPPNILNNKTTITIEMQDVFYKVKSVQNAYGIIYTLELEI